MDIFEIGAMDVAEYEKLQKAGEGSRGGRVIGHTKSGKAIYVRVHPKSYSKQFTEADHADAATLHQAHASSGMLDAPKHDSAAAWHNEQYGRGLSMKRYAQAALKQEMTRRAARKSARPNDAVYRFGGVQNLVAVNSDVGAELLAKCGMVALNHPRFGGGDIDLTRGMDGQKSVLEK